jgi:hypothetical protein
MRSCSDGINGLFKDQPIERGVIASLQNDISLLGEIKKPFLKRGAPRLKRYIPVSVWRRWFFLIIG